MDTAARHVAPRMIHSNGHRIGAYAHNEGARGTPIIFIHGVLVSARFSKHILEPVLASSRPWFSVGLPGHFPSVAPEGFSAEDVDAKLFTAFVSDAVDQLVGDQPVILAGHSTGGFAALNYAIDRPANLRGVISVGGFSDGRWGGLEGLLQRLARGGPPGRALFRASLRLTRESEWSYRSLSHFLTSPRSEYRSYPQLKEAFAESFADFREMKVDALEALFRRIPDLDVTDRLHRIQVPTLVMAGENDPVISFEHSRDIAQRIPAATLASFADTGHMMFFERPLAFKSKLHLWLEKQSHTSTSSAATQQIGATR